MSDTNYTLQKPNTYIDRLSLKKRLEMFDLFTTIFPSHELNSVLDAGVTADKNAQSSNYFEKFFPEKNKIIALSNQNATFLEEIYPGLRFQSGDVKALPFPSKSIDVIFSSAVIEHIGSYENQKKMIAECVRVSKKGVFITTPNRWHPIEVHTLLPVIHWLPKKIHRTILNMLGLSFYADEQNMNLLDVKILKKICNELKVINYNIFHIKTFGLTSNLVLVIH